EPISAPITDIVPSRTERRRWPPSSERYPSVPDSPPGTSPIVFDTLACTGAYPNASSTGNVINVPLPTTVLTVPAPNPAAAIAMASGTDMTATVLHLPGGRRHQGRRDRPRARGGDRLRRARAGLGAPPGAGLRAVRRQPHTRARGVAP